jgi:hypothetical protein
MLHTPESEHTKPWSHGQRAVRGAGMDRQDEDALRQLRRPAGLAAVR